MVDVWGPKKKQGLTGVMNGILFVGLSFDSGGGGMASDPS